MNQIIRMRPIASLKEVIFSTFSLFKMLCRNCVEISAFALDLSWSVNDLPVGQVSPEHAAEFQDFVVNLWKKRSIFLLLAIIIFKLNVCWTQ